MTLEQLKEQALITNTEGRPTSYMTNEKWQREFELRKSFITPSKERRMKAMSSEHCTEYHGETLNHYYRQYINDVLKNIRAGNIDYCYFIYQIEDLLRYEYDRLVTYYNADYECWTVCLKGDF